MPSQSRVAITAILSTAPVVMNTKTAKATIREISKRFNGALQESAGRKIVLYYGQVIYRLIAYPCQDLGGLAWVIDLDKTKEIWMQN